MRATTAHSSHLEVWQLVRRQHGVIARRQMTAFGFSAKAIRHRVATGRLHPVRRGIYAVGRPEVTQHGGWMAAVLACGPDAALSHHSAAALLRLRPRRSGPIHVSVPTDRALRLPGIELQRRSALQPIEHEGIPTTNPAETLIDLATLLPRNALEAAVNEADKHDLIDPDALRKKLDATAPRPGVRALRELLDRATFRLTDSELERRFLRLVRAAGLAAPETRHRREGHRIDFVWPALNLIVETDGLRYHRTPFQQAKDRRRDQDHVAAGRTVLRFTHGQIRFEPEHVRETLRAVLARLD